MLRIPVFLCTDNNYAPYAATVIASILMHTKEFIEFYIIDAGISKKNKKLISFQNFNNFSIEFIKIDTEKYFKNFPVLPSITSAMYGRYLIAELKPDIKKAVYTDVDAIFTGDIKELYDEPLDDYMLGAVPSQRGRLNNNYYEVKKTLNLDYEHKFFMSGLLLIDCEFWRKNKIFQKLMTETKKHAKKLVCPDQEIFNIVFNNNYKPLDVRYCVIYKIFKDCYTDEEIENLIKRQLIIHYPGGGFSKPWNNKELLSADYFWDVLNYTNFVKKVSKDYSDLQIKLKIDKYKNRIFNLLSPEKIFKKLMAAIQIIIGGGGKLSRNYEYGFFCEEICYGSY